VYVKLPPGAASKQRFAWARKVAAGAGSAPKGFIPLSEAAQIPVGSKLDTRRGTVGLTLARNRDGTKSQTGTFRGGRFVLRQSQRKALTTLAMRGGGLNRCRTAKSKLRSKQATTSRKRRRSRRRLFGSSRRGRFRTRGRRSTATVRGTRWLQKDTCKGTLTRVRRGKVVVKETGKRKRVVLTASGKRKRLRHFARAPRR
jgi:hypothetical protein